MRFVLLGVGTSNSTVKRVMLRYWHYLALRKIFFSFGHVKVNVPVLDADPMAFAILSCDHTNA